MKETYKSKVYTDRPDYADFPAPRKFVAIESIIAKRLTQHPNAICSYSGGSDSDIMIDLIERTRAIFNLPPIKYAFFNTGLEMKAIKDHVKATAEKYGVEIAEYRPKVNIVAASRKYGIPFVSKIMSSGLSGWQKKGIPLTIADEYEQAEDKAAKRRELRERYPKCESVINFLCGCNSAGEPRPNIQLVINSSKYMRDFIGECPPDFQISAKCCDYCKKQLAHRVQKGYDMIVTGERRAEGGMRSVPRKDNTALCFTETSSGQYRLRPLYYVTDADKAWYKDYYGIRYSDAYEVYGLTRTGCCGCPISHKAVEDLEKIRPYEPNVVKAAWNIFGKSYEYRAKYNQYKADRMLAERNKKRQAEGQESLFEAGRIMRIGLIDVDGHNFPNLCLMKLSAWHKAQGHTVEWWWGFGEYDRVYMSKVFDATYSPDIPEPLNAREIIKGGTGYGLDNRLPDEVEHICPDYSLYPELTRDTAYGFLTRGCPRGCHFCIVAEKEGRASRKMADLSEWWTGQKNIKLLDPNLLACREHMDLLGQLADSGAWVDFTQGLDCRLLTEENIAAIGTIKLKEIHFAWDYMAESEAVLRGLRLYAEHAARKPHGQYASVYVLTNYDTTMEENLYRLYTLRDMGFDPYVMIYDKPSAPREIRMLQRWCNNRRIFRSEPDFYKYDPKQEGQYGTIDFEKR